MESGQNLHVAAGRLFFFSEGEYSDYQHTGHFVALRDIDMDLINEVIQGIEERIRSGELTYYGETIDDDDECFEWRSTVKDHFLPAFIATGAVLEVDVQEIHTGAYGRLYFR